MVIFLSTKTLANNKYYKCPEKISKVIRGQDSLLKEGSILGINYVKFHINQSITIKFKYTDSKENPFEIISNKKLKKNSLGYEVYNKLSKNDLTVENTYNFVKLNDNYAFTRNENWWSPKLENQPQKNYEYESSGRCVKIKKNEFNVGKITQIAKIAKKEKKKIIQKKIIKNENQIIGKRTFALSWEGVDELIIGQLTFEEKNLVGKLEFNHPEDESKCIGTYALSTTRGTWSLLCEKKNTNASGILKWNSKNGNVSGNGTDSKGKKVKFKVSGSN
jgi:hypothetical protein